MNDLVEVRCPLKSKKDNKEYACNKLAVRVKPGASGVAYCPVHKQEFPFEVVDPAKGEPLFASEDSPQQ